MRGLVQALMLPAVRYALFVLVSTAAIGLVHLLLSPRGLEPLVSSLVVSQIPGALWQWAFPIARVGLIVGLCAAFLALGLGAARMPPPWVFLLVGVFAGGLTGYSLFSITPSVHFLPVLEYFAVAMYTLAATQVVKR